MNVLPINNNTHNTNFGKVNIIGYASPEVKKLVENSILNRNSMDLIAKVDARMTGFSNWDYPVGTLLYRIKIGKKPNTFVGKLLNKLGIIKGEYLTRRYHTVQGTECALNDKHVSGILEKL